MKISRRAIDRFLARPRRDFRPWKDLPARKLDALADKLPVAPPFWKRFRVHQKACFIIGARCGKFAFYNDTGTGKTLLSIALARYFYYKGDVDRVLVLVPNKPNKDEWRLELEKHAPNIPFVVLEGTSVDKWAQLDENPDAFFVIETFMGLVRMVCTKEKRKRSKKMKLTPSKKLVKRLLALFQGLVTDEGTVLGSVHNLPFRICRQIVKTAPFYANLTATPFGREPDLLWSQMYLVDGGYTLGETLGLFRAALYREVLNPMGFPDYVFRKRMKPMLNRLLAHASISIEANAADLPRVNRIPKFVSLPGDAGSYYEKAKAKLIASHGNYQETKNAFLRLRQISSGFVGFYDDELGTKASLEFDENPKLDMLLSVVESINPRYKIIVFHEFTYSGLRICRELVKLGIGHAHLYGGTKDTKRERLRFNNDRDCQVLVLQNKFGKGLNLQVARYGLFYESPVSTIDRKQCERRVERQYSEHDVVFLYDLLMRDTVDERILEFVKEGRDLLEAVLRGRDRHRALTEPLKKAA